MALRLVHTVYDEPNAVRVMRDSETGEYVCKLYRRISHSAVRFWGNFEHYEPADYFTDDKQDAIDTARVMAATRTAG